MSPRKAAQEKGLNTYFTGKPCVNGHVSARTTTNGTCMECSLSRAAEWKRKNRSKLDTSSVTRWVKANPERVKEIKAKNYARNKERYLQANERWRSENAERMNAYKATYRRVHKQRIRANKRVRDLYKKGFPLTESQRDWLYFIYEQCPKGWHVDHIHPLKGENFCGLHVPWNLQHLPASVNQSKGNRLSLDSVSA